MRYDACVIGAGAEGLAAAATLAQHGLSVIVAERETRAGGRLMLREFHPGFRAPPFADAIAPVPPELFRALDLGRRGAALLPAPASLALWPERASLRLPWAEKPAGAETLRREAVARALADAERPKRRWYERRRPASVWPGEELGALTLAEAFADEPEHRVADVLSGLVCDPSAPATALQLLAGGPGCYARGLGEALRLAAEEAGAQFSLGLEVTDVKHKGGRVMGVGLADGSDIETRAVISTLDFKRTFLSLFAWNVLPHAVVERVGAFRPAPGIARLLLALDGVPELAGGIDPIALRGPIHVAPGAFEEAYRSWRRGAVPDNPPAMLRLVSALDPALAPDGKAVLTITLGGIPHTPFDGEWTHGKRGKLLQAAVKAAESAFPSVGARILASLLFVPPDIESLLGATAGDLWGGELSADQMLGMRPFPQQTGTRTPFRGLYLAGASSVLGPLASCASGVAAACALIADRKAGQLR